MKYKVKLIDRNAGWGMKDARNKKIVSKFSQCKDMYTPPIGKGGMLITGFIDNDTPDKDGNVHPLALKRQNIESMLGLPKGGLYKSSDFWFTDFRFAITGTGIILDTDEALGMLRHTVLEADPEVAKTLDAVENNAKCKWSMLTDETVAKEKNAKKSIKFDAIAAFVKLSQADIVKVLSLYNIDATDTDPETNKNILTDYVESKPQLFLDRVNDKDLNIKSTLNLALKKGVVERDGLNENSVYRFMGNDLAFGLDNTISFIKAKENQAIYTAIVKELKK